MQSTLSERLRERLDALDMNDAQLARQVGVARSSMSLWMNGTTKTIKGANLLKAAAALKVTPDWLVTGLGKKFANENEGAGATEDLVHVPPNVPSISRVYVGPPDIAEAIRLLEAMNDDARADAIAFLRVYGSKKGAQLGQGEGASVLAERAAQQR